MKKMTYLLILIGLVMLAFGSMYLIFAGINLINESDIYARLILGIILTVPGLLLTITQIRSGILWNRIIKVAGSHREISLEQIAAKTNVSLHKTRSILFDAITSGVIGATIEDDVLRHAAASPSSGVTTPSKQEKVITERVLVICPFCGAKTEQGLSKCQNCQADL